MEIPALYNRYFVQNGSERRELFQCITENFETGKTLYAGSFVHITPSIFIPDVTYVDNDKRVQTFFDSPAIPAYIDSLKQYSGSPIINALQADFTKPLPFRKESFQSLFSFYAGFISKYCEAYLKSGGLLFVNDSHGDAFVANCNPSYSLHAVLSYTEGVWSVSKSELERYFIVKRGSVSLDEVLNSMKGPTYQTRADIYCFKKL